MTCPAYCWVASLYCRQKSMMLTPCWPSAVPTGGAGVACAARICSLTNARIFLRRLGAESATACHLLRCKRLVQSLPRSSLYLRDLIEPQLDRRLPVEDVDQDLQLALV